MRLDCPHCNRENVSMQIVDVAVGPRDYRLFCRCRSCMEMVIFCATVYSKDTLKHLKANEHLEAFDGLVSINATWPRHFHHSAPGYVSDDVARVFVQAASALRRGEIDSATAMARKTVQLALGDLNQTVEGQKLHKAIDDLVAAGNLPQALGEWAHAIRLLGNDGAHDRAPPTKEEAADALAFARYFLLYAFTLPKEVAEARATRQARKDT